MTYLNEMYAVAFGSINLL